MCDLCDLVVRDQHGNLVQMISTVRHDDEITVTVSTDLVYPNTERVK